jgi:biotin synthase-related radical SAM superfamily protein
MEDKEVALDLKAELLCRGVLHVPDDIRIPFPTSKSSSGPGAGSESVVVCFSGKRVKVPISRHEGDLVLRQIGEADYEVLKGGKALIRNVGLIPTLCHAPGQAFVSLGRSCNMKCAFCTINEAGTREDVTVDSAMEMIIAASKKKGFKAVAVTSGVPKTIGDQIDKLASVIAAVRKELPKTPIGVEPLALKRSDIAKLKKAGATEIKINLEAATREIFEKVCPNRDCQATIKAIGLAVEEFGKGAVTSNIIVGLGETDEEVRNALEMLAGIGSVANIRAVRINALNRERLQIALGDIRPLDKERMIRLARMQKAILAEHGLSTKAFKTMCFPCSCCDLVPEIDL